jgi:hypothetical protein
VAHFAHAAANLLRSLTVRQAADYGADLLDLIAHEITIETPHRGRSRRKPTQTQLRAVATQLSRKRALETEIDRSFGWIADLMGFDEIEQRILVTFARWSQFEDGVRWSANRPMIATI